jgi:hypothetical protein
MLGGLDSNQDLHFIRVIEVTVCRRSGLMRVNEGDRTLDLQDHNLALCRLSYIHHECFRVDIDLRFISALSN